MRKELFPVLLAAALVGSACQRPPEATPLPQRTPLAASGESKPLNIEAAIQAAVRATVTAQQETTFKTTQPELELFEASSFEFKYPKGWIKEENQHLPISFIDPKSAKDNPTKITFFISGNPFGSSANIDTLLEDIERREGMSLSRSNYKGPPPKAKQIPPVDRKPAYIISVERVPDPEGKPEYDLNTFIIFSAKEIVHFNLFTDPSVTDKIKPLFETVVRTFKERPVQRVEVPPKAPPPRAEAQKPAPATSERQTIFLRPNELYRKLLTTPFSPDDLDLTSLLGNRVWELAVEDRTFGAIGKVRMILGTRFNSSLQAEIIYTIFPDKSAAKGAYDMSATIPSHLEIPGFNYPAIMSTRNSVVLVDNVLVNTRFLAPDQPEQQRVTVFFTESAVKHLQRAGR